jgi:hypothetical protein
MLVYSRASDSEMIGLLIDGHPLLTIEKQCQNLALRIATDGFQKCLPTALIEGQ